MKKVYCYVDESGQDPKSEFFVVVAVVNDKEQSAMRKVLLEVEKQARTGKRKWHKSKPERRQQYINTILNRKIAKGEIYFGHYKKPLPYFLPMLETISKALSAQHSHNYQAIVCIDGIDKKKAGEITNALRIRGIRLPMVRSKRDESEPLIRLADMWAGCIRGAFLNKESSKQLFEKAKKEKHIIDVNKNLSKREQ